MSDYTDTLRKKGREIAKKRAEITERMQADSLELTKLTAAEAGIAALLRLEGVVVPDLPSGGNNPPTSKPYAPHKPSKPLLLSDVLKETLSDGQIKHVNDLIDAARSRGIDFGDKSPFRTVNFTLMGIKSGKTIERMEGDRWRRIG